MSDQISAPGRRLLGVAPPRWCCGYADCESGTIWRTRTACELCAEIVQDKAAAARERARRAAAGLCLQHGTRPGPSGRCGDCGLETMAARPADTPARRTVEGPERGTCGERGARIFMAGPASVPRTVAVVPAPAPPRAGTPAPVEPVEEPGPRTCQGQEQGAPCTRGTLPLRRLCRWHMVQQIAGVVA
ncbi:hypothetical protein [Streptomyces sp. NPDC002559]